MSEQPGTGPDEHLANVLGTVSLRVMTRVAAAVEDATGLTMVQATALSALGVHAGDVRSGASIDQLRRWVELSHSATVRLVDRLVEAGLVERRETASDR
ncbi:MAG: MarR family transcriptional regulator, partial [Williamsia herbipolensis]|nr:MarR family transcriptional regulator [Williamsia herbipolensis]